MTTEQEIFDKYKYSMNKTKEAEQLANTFARYISINVQLKDINKVLQKAIQEAYEEGQIRCMESHERIKAQQSNLIRAYERAKIIEMLGEMIDTIRENKNEKNKFEEAIQFLDIAQLKVKEMKP
jgi:hypothetical protein